MEAYSALAAGAPVPGPLAVRPVKDSEVATIAPRGLWQKVTNPAVIELWSTPGAKLTQNQGVVPKGQGMVAVLGAGNFEACSDVLFNLFIRGNVCIIKSHPCNALSADFLSAAALSSLARDGYVGLCTGGVEMSNAILNHPLTVSWMMTGGCMTYDAITWGKDGKKRGVKQLDKPCHAELGAASPYIVVPGEWSEKELVAQAHLLVGYKNFNTGHICASPQIIILDRNWPLAQRFVDHVVQAAAQLPAVAPYYAGAESRLRACQEHCPSAQKIQNGFIIVHDVDAEGGGGDYMMKNELFAPGFGFKFVEGNNDAAAFFSKVVPLVNEQCFGSLSLSIAIDPRTRAGLGKKAFDEILCDIQWGTVGVNVWAAYMNGNSLGTWGAPPGRHSDEDIQSGKGLMGNALLFNNVSKSTIEGQWCDPMLATLVTPSAKAKSVIRAAANLVVQQSVGALVRTLAAVLF